MRQAMNLDATRHHSSSPKTRNYSFVPTLSHAQALLEASRAEEALIVVEQAITDARQTSSIHSLVKGLLTRAMAARSLGFIHIVEASCHEGIALLDDRPENLNLRGRLRTELAIALDQAERIAAAAAVYEAAIQDLDAAPKGETLTAAKLRNNLAMIYKGLGQHAQAETHCVHALNALETAMGRDHEEVAALYNNLGTLYYTVGFANEAKQMFAHGLAIREKLLPMYHSDIAQSLTNLATAKHELGEDDEALQDFARAVSILQRNIQEKASSYEAATEDYATLLEALGKFDEAEDIRHKAKQALATT